MVDLLPSKQGRGERCDAIGATDISVTVVARKVAPPVMYGMCVPMAKILMLQNVGTQALLSLLSLPAQCRPTYFAARLANGQGVQ